MNNYRASRYRRGSKEIIFPKIDRTTDLIDSSLEEVAVPASQLDYRYVSDREIEMEYDSLREQLLRLNQKVGKQVLSLQSKSFKANRQSLPIDHKMQLLQEEIKNNDLIISRLGLEMAALVSRLSQLKAIDKQTLEERIKETQSNIQALKIKNKANSHSNQKGTDILDFSEFMIHQLIGLENEKIQVSRKQKKLESRRVQVSNNQEKILEALQEIQYKYKLANQTIEQFQRNHSVQNEGRVLEEKWREKQRKLKALIQSKQSVEKIKDIAFSQIINRVLEAKAKIAAYDIAIKEIEKQKDQKEKQWRLQKEQLQRIRTLPKNLSLEKEQIKIKETFQHKQGRYRQHIGTSATIHIVQKRKDRHGKQDVSSGPFQIIRQSKEPKQESKPLKRINIASVRKIIELQPANRSNTKEYANHQIEPNSQKITLETVGLTTDLPKNPNNFELKEQIMIYNNDVTQQRKSQPQYDVLSGQNKLEKDQDLEGNKMQIEQTLNQVSIFDNQRKQAGPKETHEIQKKESNDGRTIIMYDFVNDERRSIENKDKFSIDLTNLNKGQKRNRLLKQNERTTNEDIKEGSEQASEEVSEQIIKEDQLISQQP